MNGKIQQRVFAVLRIARTVLSLTVVLFPVMLVAQSTRQQPATGGGSYKVLYRFKGGSDGEFPGGDGVLLDASTGDLYGTTVQGGIPGECTNANHDGCGTVYSLNPTTGKETVLYRFQPQSGAYPGSLVQDAKGELWGLAGGGGSSGAGSVFKLARLKPHHVTFLFNFNGEDGADPADQGGFLLDSSGNIYGTTQYGGNSSACDYGGGGCGTAFKLDAHRHETVLHNFAGSGGDGADVWAGLIMDKAGNLYGTTFFGGDLSCNAPYGCGTIFKLDAKGKETILHTYKASHGGFPDGAFPVAGLIDDAEGNLYGTTLGGGNQSCSNGGCGTVFKLDTSGHLTVLHKFTGGDGEHSQAPLVMDAAGNLYGTVTDGGKGHGCSGGCGTVFKLDTSGHLTVLHNFTGGTGGGYPASGLVFDSSGNLYGTTEVGGEGCALNPNHGCGVVFEIAP